MCKCERMELTAIKSAIYGLVSNLMKDDLNLQMILAETIAYWSATLIGNWIQRYYTMIAEKRKMNTDVYGVCVCQVIRQLIMIAAKQIYNYITEGTIDKYGFMQDMMIMPVLENITEWIKPIDSETKTDISLIPIQEKRIVQTTKNYEKFINY